MGLSLTNIKNCLVPHFQNSFLHTYSFLLFFLDAPPSETVIDDSKHYDHAKQTSQDCHDVVGSCGWISSWVFWPHSPCGERQTGVVVSLRFAYRNHAKGVVRVWFQLVQSNHLLLVFKGHDVCNKGLVILGEDVHLTVWSWNLHY